MNQNESDTPAGGLSDHLSKQNSVSEIDATTILSEGEEREAVYRHVFMGQTQQAAGDALGVSGSTVSNIMAAYRRISGTELELAILDQFTDAEDYRGDGDDREYLTEDGGPREDDSDDEAELVTDGGEDVDARVYARAEEGDTLDAGTAAGECTVVDVQEYAVTAESEDGTDWFTIYRHDTASYRVRGETRHGVTFDRLVPKDRVTLTPSDDELVTDGGEDYDATAVVKAVRLPVGSGEPGFTVGRADGETGDGTMSGSVGAAVEISSYVDPIIDALEALGVDPEQYEELPETPRRRADRDEDTTYNIEVATVAVNTDADPEDPDAIRVELTPEAKSRIPNDDPVTDGGEDILAAEITSASYDEGDEWQFVADIRVRLYNPTGDDVVALQTYKARPKYDDLTHTPERVHEYVEYWRPDAYPNQGDSPFYDMSTEWEPSSDITDDDALFEECKDIAIFDPAAVLENFRYNDLITDGGIDTATFDQWGEVLEAAEDGDIALGARVRVTYQAMCTGSTKSVEGSLTTTETPTFSGKTVDGFWVLGQSNQRIGRICGIEITPPTPQLPVDTRSAR